MPNITDDEDEVDIDEGGEPWLIKAEHRKDTTLEPHLRTTFCLPWCAQGQRSGPTGSWQCVQAKLCANRTSETGEHIGMRSLDICAYKHAIRTADHKEWWVFAVAVYEAPCGTDLPGQTHTSLRCMEVTQARKRGRAPSGKSAGVGSVRSFNANPNPVLSLSPGIDPDLQP